MSESSQGKAKRIAQYLAQEVGEGNVFRPEDLQALVPDGTPTDRPMRALRSCGWVIQNYKTKASLRPGELYLETIGDRVWEDGYRWPRSGPAPSVRRRVLDRDGPRCRICGIVFGDPFPDAPAVVAQATIVRVDDTGRDDDPAAFCAECQRCSADDSARAPRDAQDLIAQIAALDTDDRKALLKWMGAGARSYAPREEFWVRYLQLDEDTRAQVQAALIDAL